MDLPSHTEGYLYVKNQMKLERKLSKCRLTRGDTPELSPTRPRNFLELRDGIELNSHQVPAQDLNVVRHQENRPIQLPNISIIPPTKHEATLKPQTPTHSRTCNRDSKDLAYIPSNKRQSPRIKIDCDDVIFCDTAIPSVEQFDGPGSPEVQSPPGSGPKKRSQARWEFFKFSEEDVDFILFLTLHCIPPDVVARQWRFRHGYDEMVPIDKSNDGYFFSGLINSIYQRGGNEKTARNWVHRILKYADQDGWRRVLDRARLFVDTSCNPDGGKRVRQRVFHEKTAFLKHVLDKKSLPSEHEHDKLGKLAFAGLQREREEQDRASRIAISEGYILGDKIGEQEMLIGKLQELWETGTVKPAVELDSD